MRIRKYRSHHKFCCGASCFAVVVVIVRPSQIAQRATSRDYQRRRRLTFAPHTTPQLILHAHLLSLLTNDVTHTIDVITSNGMRVPSPFFFHQQTHLRWPTRSLPLCVSLCACVYAISIARSCSLSLSLHTKPTPITTHIHNRRHHQHHMTIFGYLQNPHTRATSSSLRCCC